MVINNLIHYGDIKLYFMKYLIYKSLAVLFIIIIVSNNNIFASPPQKRKYNITLCFPDSIEKFNSTININGYYRSMTIEKKTNVIGGFLSKDSLGIYMDTTYNNIMFYPNGLYVMGFGDTNQNRLKFDSISRRFKGGNVPLYFEELNKISHKKEDISFYNLEWGIYRIKNDSIIVQYLGKSRPLTFNGSWEIIFKIIDYNTIKWINTRQLDNDKQENYVKGIDDKDVYYNFHETSEQPDPDNAWILKEKWFWCNEDDWKEFMKNRKK